nr:flocculation protein FLO11-like [Aedes albopictus]
MKQLEEAEKFRQLRIEAEQEMLRKKYELLHLELESEDDDGVSRKSRVSSRVAQKNTEKWVQKEGQTDGADKAATTSSNSISQQRSTSITETVQQATVATSFVGGIVDGQTPPTTSASSTPKGPMTAPIVSVCHSGITACSSSSGAATLLAPVPEVDIGGQPSASALRTSTKDPFEEVFSKLNRAPSAFLPSGTSTNALLRQPSSIAPPPGFNQVINHAPPLPANLFPPPGPDLSVPLGCPATNLSNRMIRPHYEERSFLPVNASSLPVPASNGSGPAYSIAPSGVNANQISQQSVPLMGAQPVASFSVPPVAASSGLPANRAATPYGPNSQPCGGPPSRGDRRELATKKDNVTTLGALGSEPGLTPARLTAPGRAGTKGGSRTYPEHAIPTIFILPLESQELWNQVPQSHGVPVRCSKLCLFKYSNAPLNLSTHLHNIIHHNTIILNNNIGPHNNLILNNNTAPLNQYSPLGHQLTFTKEINPEFQIP